MSEVEDRAADGPEVEVIVTPYRDGPYLIRGGFRLVDEDGKEIPTGSHPVALCRCGRSRLRPFCDGTHRTARFRRQAAPMPSCWKSSALRLEVIHPRRDRMSPAR